MAFSRTLRKFAFRSAILLLFLIIGPLAVLVPEGPTSALPVCIYLSALESFVALSFFPQYLPPNPFLWALIRFFGLNVFVYFVYIVEIWPRLFNPMRHLPGPKGGYPVIGQGLAMFDRPPGTNFLKWVTHVPNEGVIHFRGILNQSRLLITSPKALSEILVTHPYDFEKPVKARNFLRRILGDGLIIVEGDTHKFQRKNVMPSFSFRHLKDLYPMIWEKAVALTKAASAELRELADTPAEKDAQILEGVLEVNHWANKVTMDIIGVAALGREFHSLQNDDDELIRTYEEILEPTTEKLVYFGTQLLGPQDLINKLPWGVNERVTVTTNILRRICNDLVQEKREAIKAHADSHRDILSILIKSDNFSNQELVDQMLTFLAAGHETTSSAFTWTTFMLAKHLDWQHKLREEVRAAIPDGAPPTSPEQLSSLLEGLPILNGVCQEVLRLYPTVPTTIRDSVKDTTLLGYPVPKGTQIILSPWAVNRSPHLWADADVFKPDRWIDTDEDGQTRPNNYGGATSNYSVLTFLHGPRSCIGQNFAKAELRCLVAAFVLVFDWEMANPDERVQVSGVVTTKPANGMNLRLKIIGEVS